MTITYVMFLSSTEYKVINNANNKDDAFRLLWEVYHVTREQIQKVEEYYR